MENRPDLTERTLAFFLRGHSTLERDPSVFGDLLDKPEDLQALRDYEEDKLKYSDPLLEDARQRNPFLSCNSSSFLDRLLPRMARDGKVEGMIGFMTNSYDMRIDPEHDTEEERVTRYAIAHDMGDVKEYGFIFCHEVGKRLGVEIIIREAIEGFTNAYEANWQPVINKQKIDLRHSNVNSKAAQLETYKRCLDPEFQKTIPWPLLPNDFRIIDMIVAVNQTDLALYAEKYKPAQKSWDQESIE